MSHSEAGTLASIRECRDHIVAVCTPLDSDSWHRPTALPRWDVQDVVAHLGSLEGLLLGRAEPAAADPARQWPHVRNPLGALNEPLVDRRRSWEPAAVLAEFQETSEARLAALEGLSEADLDIPVPAPTGGTVPQRNFLGIRLWDYVVHEHDIHEALGLPLRTASPGTRNLLDGLLTLFPRALAKGGAADGTQARLDIVDGAAARTLGAIVSGGRGSPSDPAVREPALHLRASPTAFLRIATGRRDPAAAIAAGDVEVAGSATLAPAVLRQLNIIP